MKPGSNSSLNRRDFLRITTALGAAAAVTAFLEGCSKAGIAQGTLISPTNTLENPTLTQEMAPSTTPTQEPMKPTETSPVRSATPTGPAEDGMARLAFVKTNDRAEGVRYHEKDQCLGIPGRTRVARREIDRVCHRDQQCDIPHNQRRSRDRGRRDCHDDGHVSRVYLLNQCCLTIAPSSGTGDSKYCAKKLDRPIISAKCLRTSASSRSGCRQSYLC